MLSDISHNGSPQAFMEPKILSDGFTCYLIGIELNKLCNLLYARASHNYAVQLKFIPNFLSFSLSISLSIVCGLCSIWETFFFQSGK